ncbi:MAG: hypothetical protein HGA96_09680 [Desulfobulbaceae bacterium]|nr:hypothetical protein [Desulfobulbaceae bacterium]
MKRLALLVGVVWLSVVGRPIISQAYYLDTPHNESNGIYCYTCHEMPYWANYTPSGVDDTLRNAVCMQCHGEDSSDPHKGPAKKLHASSTTGSKKGSWSTECTQCHDVHSQGQLDWKGSSNPFLAQGLFDTVISPKTFNLSDPLGDGYGTTAIGISSVSGQEGWTDTSKWSAKGGHMAAARATDQSRGLILVPDKANPSGTFEIVAVSGGVLKVKGKMVNAPHGQTFGIIYGQLLRSYVMPNGGTSSTDYRDVKFFKPEIISDKAGGYIDKSGSGKPMGLCQVCHDGTAYWKNDGSSVAHNSGIACGVCHNILTGLAGGANHRTFIGDYLGSGCGTCHAAQVATPESGHSGGCNTCHVEPKPTINSNILATDGGLAVCDTLSSGGYNFGPRLSDSNGKGINDPGFLGLDCSACHRLKPQALVVGNHGGHGAATFAWDGNCGDCHVPTGKGVVKDLHNLACTICHDSARSAVGDYSVRIAGNSANGIDGSAVGATALAKCSDCHNTNPVGVVHHVSKTGYAAAGNCSHCHATAGHQGNHTALVADYANCTNCHAANAGSISGAPVDQADNKKHDGCGTCHNPNTSLKNLTQVGSALVVVMPDGGGNCAGCHGEYFSRHGNADHRSRVAGNSACDACHAGTIGTATSVPTSTADNKLHDDCYTCHQSNGSVRAAYGKAPGLAAGGGDCPSCHGAYFPSHLVTHVNRVAGSSNCTGCHPDTAGDPGGMPVNASDNKVHDNCATCHDEQSNNLLKAAYGKASAMPAGGGDCNGCHGAYFVKHGNADHRAKVAMNAACSGCHEGTQGNITGVPVNNLNNMVHDACTTCHDASTGGLVGLAAGHNGGGDCLTCHAGHDSSLDHEHRVSSFCANCHAAGGAVAVDSLHGSCQTCHAYSGNRLNPATVAAVISAGIAGDNQSCENCHTVNLHHATREAVNNDCTTTCHPAVDHRNQVAGNAACVGCHTGTSGSASGIPVSLSDAAIHDSCRTCHTFDAQGRGTLVSFTNLKGVNGLGQLPLGGGDCTVCHTLATPTPTSASMASIHHSSPRTAKGQCEYCHEDPMPSWSPDIPGDNGNLSGLTPARPTQMACRECHVAFSGASMTVTKFSRTDYTNYGSDWTRSTAHLLPVTATAINNYGICFSCHFVGSSKVPAAAQVTIWHARPDKYGGSLGWAFYNQTSTDAAGKSSYRASCNGDQAHYLPGRSSSGIGGFNIFAPNYGLYLNPSGLNYDYEDEGDASTHHCGDYDTFSASGASADFIRIALPALPQLGSTSSQAVPVFASLAPASPSSAAADDIKVSSAVWNGTNLYAIATTSNSSGCATLAATYNGHNQAFAGTTTCVATFPVTVVYTSLLPTLNVMTSNSSGLNVTGYPIRENLNPGSDTTPPIASAVLVTPATANHVPVAFTLTTEFIDEESAVTSCAYSSNGAIWTPGVLSGSTPLYTCTANLGEMSGVLALNMRATSMGGVGAASGIARTVDAVAPVDGTLTVTADFSQNSLSWSPAMDGGSGLRTANTYDVRFQTGATPPTCSSGSSLYQGTATSYTHNALVNETPYSYRVCAYDNLNNVSTGAPGSGTPHDLTAPEAGVVSVTPVYNIYVPSAFTVTTAFTDTQTPVTSCEYTSNGSTWTPGAVSGSSPSYSCTANLSAMSGSLSLNMRATSAGGLSTAALINRTVDQSPPTDGTLLVTPGLAQNSLSWTAATDSQSGLPPVYAYNVRFLVGAVAPTCSSGTLLYQGPSRSYTHPGLSNGTQYSYRVCAYDNLNNVSPGATGSGTPSITLPTLASPTATNIGSTTATLGANITAGASLLARGTAWGILAAPTGNQLAEGGTAPGLFSQARTGLPADAKIFYRGYATNSAGTGYSPDGSFYTEPATPAAGVSFTAVSQTGLTVNWTRGSGEGVIVLMKQGAAVSSAPADGTYTGYTANPQFSYGTQIGTGNYVVYKGTGTSVAVTGMTAGTIYYLAVYEYRGMVNSSGVNQGSNYSAVAATGSQATNSSAPPLLTSPTATAIGTATAVLGANITVGAPITSRGTVWGTAGAPTSNPLAEGGSATGLFSQAITGLPAGTKIYYRGYATNSFGSGYSPEGSFYTEPATPASGISFSGVGQTGMTVNWTRGNGDGVIVLVRQGAAVNADPGDGIFTAYTANSAFGSGTSVGTGNYVVYKGTGASVSLTGLVPGTSYYLAVYEYQGTVDTAGVNLGANYQSIPATGNQQTSAGVGPYSFTFDYTGSVQTITIPAGAKNLQFTVKGAGGGGGRADNMGDQEDGQNGHLVVMSSAVSDLTLRIYVGGGGAEGSQSTSGSPGGWGYVLGGAGGDGEDYSWDCNGDWAFGGAGGGGSSAILSDANGNVLSEAAGGGGGRSSGYYGDCYDSMGGPGGGGGGADIPGVTNPAGGGAGGVAIGPSPGGNGQVIITYEFDTGVRPTVVAPVAPTIGSTTATLGATVSNGGDSSLSARGTLWGTAAAPTGNLAAEGTTVTGPFTQARTGLPAGTKIFYRGYATNSSGTSYSQDGSFYTEPATPASGLSFTGVGQTGMTVNWARGSGDGVIVLMKQGAAVNADPVDGTFSGYTANPQFSYGIQIGTGNYVVYKGTGTSVAVTGLTLGTTYHLAVYEYKGSVNSAGADLGTNYKPLAATGSQATGSPVPPILAAPTATTIGSTTVTLGANITAGAGLTSRGTVWGALPTPSGNQLAEGGSAIGLFTQARTALPAGAKIYYRGYATNSAGTGYSPDGSFYTEPAAPTSGLNFTLVSATGMTVNWSSGDGDGVIVLMKRGAAVNSEPMDGAYAAYLANPAFTSGSQIGSGNYVVYKGAGSSVAVTGLTAGATYYLAAYEFKGTVDTSGVNQGTNYHPTPGTGVQTTSAGSGSSTINLTYTDTVTPYLNRNIYLDAVAAEWNETSAVTINVTIASGVFMGSYAPNYPALISNNPTVIPAQIFPVGTVINVTNNGTIVGAGGYGGGSEANGGRGGDAFVISYPLALHNQGNISGGGGGGGGGGDDHGDGHGGIGGQGAGLAGAQPGEYVYYDEHEDGNYECIAVSGGNGGSLGFSGANGENANSNSGGTGGAPGWAISGIANVTNSAWGDTGVFAGNNVQAENNAALAFQTVH